MNEEKRDLVKDLELCEAATPGPWTELLAQGGYIINHECGEETARVIRGAGGVRRSEDAAFIAAARTGWPHAIRRVMAAEAKLHAAVIIAEVMRDFVEDGYVIADEELADALKVFFPDAEFPFVKEEE